MTDPHAAFFADPETNAAHLDQCAECRAIFERLGRPVGGSVQLRELPFAGWEGAAHRSWAFVASCSAILLLVAILLCRAAGISPLQAVTMDASLGPWRAILLAAAGEVPRWAVLFAFVVVNSLL